MLSSLRRADACRKHDCIPTILERLFWQISGRSTPAGNVRNVAIVPVNAPEAETNWAIDFELTHQMASAISKVAK